MTTPSTNPLRLGMLNSDSLSLINSVSIVMYSSKLRR